MSCQRSWWWLRSCSNPSASASASGRSSCSLPSWPCFRRCCGKNCNYWGCSCYSVQFSEILRPIFLLAPTSRSCSSFSGCRSCSWSSLRRWNFSTGRSRSNRPWRSCSCWRSSGSCSCHNSSGSLRWRKPSLRQSRLSSSPSS